MFEAWASLLPTTGHLSLVWTASPTQSLSADVSLSLPTACITNVAHDIFA